MTILRLTLMAPISFTLVILHALPYIPRPYRLFGVVVPREIRYGSEGRKMLRRYGLQLLPWTVATLLAALWLPFTWAAMWLAFVTFIPLIAAAQAFSRGRASALHFALPAPSTREVQLTEKVDQLLLPVSLFLVPLAMLAGAALYVHLHWNEIPARFPVHWGIDGTANGWSTRSLPGVYRPLIIGSMGVLFLMAISAISSWGSRKNAFSAASKITVIAVSFVIAAAFSWVGLLPFHAHSMRGVLCLDVASFGFLAAMVCPSLLRHAESGTDTGEITPDACWHGDQFYYNPNDPALFVEKRIGIGVTINFGNPRSWIVLALTLLFIALVFLVSRFTHA